MLEARPDDSFELVRVNLQAQLALELSRDILESSEFEWANSVSSDYDSRKQ